MGIRGFHTFISSTNLEYDVSQQAHTKNQDSKTFIEAAAVAVDVSDILHTCARRFEHFRAWLFLFFCLCASRSHAHPPYFWVGGLFISHFSTARTSSFQGLLSETLKSLRSILSLFKIYDADAKVCLCPKIASSLLVHRMQRP